MRRDSLPLELARFRDACGASLSRSGVNEVAFRRGDLEKALSLLEEMGTVALLGADVFELASDDAVVTPGNWFCDREPDESWRAYAQRSLRHARERVAQLTPKPDPDTLFVLVIADGPAYPSSRVTH